jgi:hypothetical protein
MSNTLTKTKDKHICPKCKGKQIFIGDTWLCTSCDKTTYEDILWLIKFIESKRECIKECAKLH